MCFRRFEKATKTLNCFLNSCKPFLQFLYSDYTGLYRKAPKALATHQSITTEALEFSVSVDECN